MRYDEETALQQAAKGGVRARDKTLILPRGGIGLKTRGAVDYLERLCGYRAERQEDQ